MPRYFFNVHDGREIPDDEGIELVGLEAAREQAVVCAGEILRENMHDFWGGEEWKMDVADEQGITLFTLVFIATDAHSKGSAELR